MKDLVFAGRSADNDNSRNPLRPLHLAMPHPIKKALGWLTNAVVREAPERTLPAAQALELSHSARCVWNLREEA